METDPPLSAVQLPTACANTLPSINTVTWHTHTRSINAYSRGGRHTLAIWFQQQLTFPATHYTRRVPLPFDIQQNSTHYIQYVYECQRIHLGLILTKLLGPGLSCDN